MRKSTLFSRTMWLGLLLCGASAFAQETPRHLFFRVTLGPQVHQRVSGRLLVFMESAEMAKSDAHGGKVEAIDLSPFSPTSVAVAARENVTLQSGDAVEIDTDEIASPKGFSQLPDGNYMAQALLDTGHTYNYIGRGEGDIVSAVVEIHKSGNTMTAEPTFALDEVLKSDERLMRRSQPASTDEAKQATRDLDFISPVLSKFWGRPIHMRGWVVVPPGYDQHAEERYPTVYATHGFGGNKERLIGTATRTYEDMLNKKCPPMIYVLLDESSATGTHEFADSVNNGPWGEALTTELIPHLESQYRMDGKASGRFLTGHSSGGWATLWLQVRYPKIFGGTWSTSPDPSDFHSFSGIDLYAPHANVFHQADGTPWPIVRDQGKVIATMQEFSKMELVLGDYGGQFASFDWVFSPRGADGRPEQMFDRETGDVNPAVVEYWRDHYDIAYRLQTYWPELVKDLDGKIHVIVGTADTFYLDAPAHKLQEVLDRLHAKSSFRFLDGRTHMNLYVVGDDRTGLSKQIAWEMYRVARPDSPLHP